MTFLQHMKTELKSDLLSLNVKMDELSGSVQELKQENEALKRENSEIKSELRRMSERMDKLEGHSRRNNLRIVGVKGRYDENWDQTELRVREVLDEKLQMTNHNEIEIERAHRLKGRDKETCPIIVKFSRIDVQFCNAQESV